MIVTIGGREYTLNFGLGFLRAINAMQSVKMDGVATGYGAMNLIHVGYRMNDPLAFIDVIKAATDHLPQKPSNVDLELYLEELIGAGKFKETFDQLFEELKKSQVLNLAMNIQEAE